MRNDNDLIIRGAVIKFRNFSGAPGQFNSLGDRNFCLFPGEEMAGVLEKQGWNIKWTKVKPEYPDIEPEPYLQVTVNYKVKNPRIRPPRIVLVSNEGKKQTLLDEADIHILDWMEIENVDLIVAPYHWEVRGDTGIKAYLKSMYVTKYEDPLEKLYNNVPESAASLIREDDID